MVRDAANGRQLLVHAVGDRTIATLFRNESAGLPAGAECLQTGADDRTRTGDLLITNQLLYQLSYIGGLSACGNSEGADSIRGFRICRVVAFPARLRP